MKTYYVIPVVRCYTYLYIIITTTYADIDYHYRLHTRDFAYL